MSDIFCLKEIKTTVKVHPSCMEKSNEYILKELKKMENKCSKDGYIHKIVEVISRNFPRIYPSDLSGCLLFDIVYSALIHNPVQFDEIQCKISQIIVDDDFILAETESSIINVIYDDDDKVEIEKLSENDIISVIVLAKRMNLNTPKIKLVAKFKGKLY